MGRAKSFVRSIDVTVAKHAHNCRFNKAHRIESGDNRLTLKEDRSEKHYCSACGRAFLERDLARIREILDRL